jgi:hypothetical protein
MVAQEISKRIQSVILPNSRSHSQSNSNSRPDAAAANQPGSTARRKSFYVGDPNDNPANSDVDDNDDDDDNDDEHEDEEEEDFWSLPMGDPVRPFAGGNKFNRAKGSSPKVPDLGTVKEEEEEEEQEKEGGTDRGFGVKEGSYFPTFPRVSPQVEVASRVFR